MRFANKFMRLLLISTTLCAATITASAQNALDWRVFTDRFGSRVDYPAALFSQTPASADNGVTLSRPDGQASLRVFTVSNQRGESPRSFLKREFPYDRATLSYDRVTPRFFAVSAVRKGSIVYTRCNFVQRIHCVELAYPRTEKRAFDPVTTRISLSLRPR